MYLYNQSGLVFKLMDIYLPFNRLQISTKHSHHQLSSIKRTLKTLLKQIILKKENLQLREELMRLEEDKVVREQNIRELNYLIQELEERLRKRTAAF